MEIFGFIALLVIGFVITLQGMGMLVVVKGFSGRWSWQALVVALIGIVVLYFTAVNAPFTLTLT